MAGQPCGKCGEIIKSREKIIYEEGKPIHYPTCPKTHKSEARDEEIPLLFKGTIDEVTSAIAEEKEAIDDYAELENKLRREGLNSEADVVNEIRNDEKDHRIKFEAMFKRLFGSSSNSDVLKRMPAKAYAMYEEARRIPKPSEVFPPSEKHKCFAGEHYFSPHSAEVCPKCGWLICTVCQKCACHLSSEAREAIEAVWETFCINCRFRPHQGYTPEV